MTMNNVSNLSIILSYGILPGSHAYKTRHEKMFEPTCTEKNMPV